MTHPLNQAIVDPRENIVIAGYGILQPRVGISVQSASLSRLANIYSGQTGFDIYTRATSDVYQDLKGEASYRQRHLRSRTLGRVLEHRFPRNALLSHDLIEGAYAPPDWSATSRSSTTTLRITARTTGASIAGSGAIGRS